MRVGTRLALVGGLTSLVFASPVGPVAAASHPAAAPATTVCIPSISGSGCVIFQDARPTKPGTSRGMKVSLTPTELTSGGELVMEIGGFKPGEGLRRWHYNLFSQGQMTEYSMDYDEADGKGRFRWKVSPATTLYTSSWGKPALCVRGIRSKRLACAEFTVAEDSTSGSQDPGTTPTDPVPGTDPASPSPSPSSTLPANCKDYGFVVMCTG